jgi:hypothetical protein
MMKSSATLWCVAAAAWAVWAGPSPAQTDARDILQRLKSQRSVVENVVITASWDDLDEGKLKSWEEQTFYWDNLGRRRLQYENGRYDDRGQRAYPADRTVTDIMYDGEIVVYRRDHSARNRLGRPAAAGETRGYHTVIVGDGQAPLKRDLESHRNPMEYLRDIAIRELEIAAEDKTPVAVRTPDPARKVYVLGYDEPKGSERSYKRSEVTVDAEKGWSVTQLESFDPKGKVMRRVAFDFVKQADGLWVPAKGVHVHWGTRALDATPVFESRFTAKATRFNDPKFDQSLFKLTLEPDTAVSDTRYQVAYRVGADKATGQDLAELARQAKSDEADAKQKVTPLKSRGVWWWVWVVVTALLALGVGGYLAFVRHRGAPAAP